MGSAFGHCLFSFCAVATTRPFIRGSREPAEENGISRPMGEGGETMPYYALPEDVLEDPDALRPWVEGALGAVQRKKTVRRRSAG